MISKSVIRKIEAEAKKYFVGASGCHDWSHVERVKKLTLFIGKKEKANLPILEIAVLLHDIGRKEEMDKKGLICHAEVGAVQAKRLLKKYKLSTAEIDNILHCIISHRYRNNHTPQTKEAKVLFDADKLDSIGAVGVARDFLFAGIAGAGVLYTGREKIVLASGRRNYVYTKDDSAIMEYEFKLKRVKDRILTKTGKKIARTRHKFMQEYFKQFWQEVEGKK